MGWSDFLNNIKRIKKTNISTLKDVSEEFDPKNDKASHPDIDKYDSAESEIATINSGIDKLREILVSNNQEISNLTKINSNISDFFNALFNDEDLVGEYIEINGNSIQMKESIVEQKLKIIELFSNIFSKYDSNTVNMLIIKLINGGKNNTLLKDVKDIIKTWRFQYDVKQGKLNSYQNKDIFAEKIIEESEKYNIDKEYQQAMKKREKQERIIREYSVNGFDLKGDDLMTMFLKNPIVEKLMIDPIIIGLHKTKDAIIDAVSGIISDMKEQNDYYNNYTSNILDLFSNRHIQDVLRSNLTELAYDDNGEKILDKDGNPKTQYDVFMSKFNNIKDSRFKFKKNKLVKDLLEDSNFYLRTKVYRKDATNSEQELLKRNPDIDKELGHKYDSNNPDDLYKLFESNCIKRSVSVFSEEFAEILLGATRNCKSKKEAMGIKDTVYTIGAMDPDLLGEKEEKIKEVLSFRKKMVDHDYKKKYNTPLEQKYVKDMENKINKDYSYELEDMKSIEKEITDIGRSAKEKWCSRKSSRIESIDEFIEKIEINMPNSTKLSPEDINNISNLLGEYKDLYSRIQKSNSTYSMYSEFIKKSAGRSR